MGESDLRALHYTRASDADGNAQCAPGAGEAGGVRLRRPGAGRRGSLGTAGGEQGTRGGGVSCDGNPRFEEPAGEPPV